MSTLNICVFGDSIAYGAWDERGGWVDRLRSFLHERAIRSGFAEYYFLYNLAIPGNTTADVLRRLSAEAGAREPHLVIFAVGINDARWRDPAKTPNVDEAEFRRNISGLIAEARRYTDKVVFVGLTPVDEGKTMPYEPGVYFENENIRRYDVILSEMAHAVGAEYIKMYDAISPADDLKDGLHPNARGHEKMFAAIRRFLSDRRMIG